MAQGFTGTFLEWLFPNTTESFRWMLKSWYQLKTWGMKRRRRIVPGVNASQADSSFFPHKSWTANIFVLWTFHATISAHPKGQRLHCYEHNTVERVQSHSPLLRSCSTTCLWSPALWALSILSYFSRVVWVGTTRMWQSGNLPELITMPPYSGVSLHKSVNMNWLESLNSFSPFDLLKGLWHES